jgi:DNA-3-methyladenine glycosylase I
MPNRCVWAETDPLLVSYHDREWGVPLHEDGKLFEFLILEGFQAGLSWLTILRKRENFRRAFDGMDAEKIAAYGEREVQELLRDAGIVRNQSKIRAAIGNARAFLSVQESFGSFDRYLWTFVGGRPIVNAWRTIGEVPATTPESDALSKDLKKRGFAFVGSTIVYAHMQATGMVMDHTTDCFRYVQLGG